MVIGGGDTGSDCIGTAVRQGARSITQLEVMPKPPEKENKPLTWPNWPLKLRTSSSQEEGCDRDWAVLTKRAVGSGGTVEALECVRVEWVKEGGRLQMREMPDSGFRLEADLVLLAMGFLGPQKPGMIEESDERPDPKLDDERRRYYRLTSFGRRVLEAEVSRYSRTLRVARASGVAPGIA